MPPFERSWPELKHPSYRKRNLISTENWLHDKQTDDGAEGLWRIHDKLYDLHGFMEKHPGGAQWLEITKGTDCTESFESHHLGGKAEAILPKYFAREASAPRNSPYTFHDDGFYRTLKKRVSKTLETLPKEDIKIRSKIIMDSLVLTSLSLAVMAAHWSSYRTAALSGVFLAFAAICSHNFFHQKDNWRMYYFNLSLMSVRDWRISHVLSHHPFTNTLQDLEITSYEPFFNYLPDPEKSWAVRYLSWIYWPLVHGTIFHTQVIHRFIHNTFTWPDVLGLIIPVLLCIANGGYILSGVLMWTWLILVSSFVFGAIDIVSAHHHPKLFHEGDAPRHDRDWGLAQIDAARDRQEFTGILPLVLIAFGDHTLHHLFPTVDHSILKYLYPVVMDTCKDFGFDFKMTSTFDLAIGQFRQLARNKPNTTPPR
nr:PREDICTED: cytochrome b5-related protein-like isoform X2 [Bemisia tabaci]